MIPYDVKSKISQLRYHFETVEYLLDYGRRRETLPFVSLLVNLMRDIDPLCVESDADSDETPLEKFLRRRGEAESTNEEIVRKIAEFSPAYLDLSDGDLEGIQYEKFVGALKRVLSKQILILKKVYKTQTEKNIQRFLLVALIMVMLAVPVFFVGKSVYTRDWGLEGSFYEGVNFEKKILSGRNERIFFLSRFEMNKKLPADAFSAKWKGYLYVPKTARYVFKVIADDGVVLKIDDKILINRWHPNNSAVFSASISLKKGFVPISIDYSEYGGGEVLKLYWSYAGQKREPIPSKNFRVKLGD